MKFLTEIKYYIKIIVVLTQYLLSVTKYVAIYSFTLKKIISK